MELDPLEMARSAEAWAAAGQAAATPSIPPNKPSSPLSKISRGKAPAKVLAEASVQAVGGATVAKAGLAGADVAAVAGDDAKP